MFSNSSLLVVPSLFFLPLLLFVLFSTSPAAGADSGGDLSMSLGSSAATKLVRNAVVSALRAPRFIKLNIASKQNARYSIAHVTSLNRVAIGSLNVQFVNDQIRVEARNVKLNSSSVINMTALPLLLDGKRVKLNAVVDKALLRLDFESPTTLTVRECALEYSDVELYLERSPFLNLLLGVVKSSLSDSMLRDQVCSMLLNTGLDLREKYLIDIPFVQLIPRKFVPYLLSSAIHIRSRLESVLATDEQITVTADVDWTEEAPSRRASFLSSLPIDVDNNSGGGGGTAFGGNAFRMSGEADGKSGEWQSAQTDEAENGSDVAAISERLLLWINDTVMNELLKQFRWDFQLIEERIPLNSPRLPLETRDFFANICPQCIFLFNISAEGLPTITIGNNAIRAKIHNRIAAEVLNPSNGVAGQKKTAIDLTLTLAMEMVPEIKEGIFHTKLNLIERKIDMKNGTAFPNQLKPVVEGLLQDMIKDDLWPALKRELEPFIYKQGVELPQQCGVNPKTAQLHFEPGRVGVSAALNIREISFGQCVAQFKNKLPKPSELFLLKASNGASLSSTF